MVPRILTIESIRPFKISTRWTTGEVSEIDFMLILKKYENKPTSRIGQVLSAEVFTQVKLDLQSQTLFWEGLTTIRLKDGSKVPAPLDFCPDVFFENSRVVG